MIKTIIVKTLYEKRWAILGWTIGLLVGNFLIIQIFPPMRDAFSSMTTNLPPELAGWFGEDGQIWTTLKGYIGLEIIGQMGLVSVIFGILFALSMTPADEQNGTLLTQLSKQVSRTQLFVSKYLVILIAAFIIMIGFGLGAWLGALVIEPIPIADFVIPTFAVMLLTLCFASLTYALATAGLGRTIAGVIIGVYALVGYFISAMQGEVDILKILSALTPFNYYNTPTVMQNGLDLGNVLVLGAIIIVPVIISLPIFRKRDLVAK